MIRSSAVLQAILNRTINNFHSIRYCSICLKASKTRAAAQIEIDPCRRSLEIEQVKLSGASMALENKRDVQENHALAPPSKKKKKSNPASEMRFNLDNCSKNADFLEALHEYDKSREEGALKFNQYSYNVVLYLCSSAALGVLAPRKSSKQNDILENSQAEDLEEAVVDEDGICLRASMAGLAGRNITNLSPEIMEMAQKRGFEIYHQMQIEKVAPNEATYTALARLAVAKRDGDLAFGIVKEMVATNIAPKLRSYGPAFYICLKNNNAEKAFEVDEHMQQCGLQADEMELEVLLQLSAKACMEDKVYSILHRLRNTVRDVSPSTVGTIERWFRSNCACNCSGKLLKADEIKAAVAARGGGWHGLGWLGNGEWKLKYTQLDEDGKCDNCQQKLVTIDIDTKETENFAQRVSKLAWQNERNKNAFKAFDDWLNQQGAFDAVVDGANVGLHNQRNPSGITLSYSQLVSVVSKLRESYHKILVVLHNRRAIGDTSVQNNLRQLQKLCSLYTTPTGSNDDWYWLYASVKSKCLLISNDEMRDHLFQLLGNSFFPQWKERHQVHFDTYSGSPKFHMPPPYSVVIQECEKGFWHIPQKGDSTTRRTWLCVSR